MCYFNKSKIIFYAAQYFHIESIIYVEYFLKYISIF